MTAAIDPRGPRYAPVFLRVEGEPEGTTSIYGREFQLRFRMRTDDGKHERDVRIDLTHAPRLEIGPPPPPPPEIHADEYRIILDAAEPDQLECVFNVSTGIVQETVTVRFTAIIDHDCGPCSRFLDLELRSHP